MRKRETRKEEKGKEGKRMRKRETRKEEKGKEGKRMRKREKKERYERIIEFNNKKTDKKICH